MTNKRLYLAAGIACALHTGYLIAAQDLILKIFYEAIPQDLSIKLAVMFYAPFVIVGFTYGLSIPPNVQVLARATFSLFCLELIPAFVLLLTILDNLCLQRPGFVRGACAQNSQDAALIQSIALKYLIFAPVLLSTLAALIGGCASCRDRTPTAKRMSPVLRVFFVFAGLIMVLFGLPGLFDGYILPAAGRGGNFPHTQSGAPIPLSGVEAHLYGGMFVLLGLFIIDLAFKLSVTTWLLRKFGVKDF